MGLNIGIVTPTIAKSATGPSTWISMLCERLCDAGHSATVVTADLAHGSEAGPSIQIDERARVKTFPVRNSLARHLYRSAEMRRWLDHNADSFDVVDIQGIWSFVAVDAARACMRAGTPYIVTTHGQMARWDWEKRWLRKQAFYQMWLKSVWRAAAAVRFLSESERRYSIDAAVAHGVVIPCWTKTPPANGVASTREATLKSDLGIAPEAQVILFLGRITAQKGVVEIIRAFDNLWHRRSDCVLLLVGPMDHEYQRLVELECRKVESRQSIRLTGPIYDERKTALFSLASLFITLSKNEGLPIAILEAMAHGLPVIVTEKANLPEVSQYEAGVIVPPESGKVAAQLDALLNVPARIRTMGENARRLIKDRFTAEVVFPRLLSTYQQVLTTPVRHDPACDRASRSGEPQRRGRFGL